MKAAFTRLASFAVLGLFLLPALTWWFTQHAQATFSEEFRAALRLGVGSEADFTPAQRDEARARIATMNVDALCDGAYPRLADFRVQVCGASQELGQFHLARRISAWTLLLGGATLGLIALLSLLAWHRPRLQLHAFVTGWWSLRAIAALEVVIQGAMLVWLSFWITAYFWNVYLIKLILIAGVLAGAGVIAAVAAIFKRVQLDHALDGERVDEAQAPELWARIRQFAQSLNTAPPAHLIAGIDSNFFVAQEPIRIPEGKLAGRSLYVSLPLLRAIGRDEADAILAHEMAHFSGGDTESGARLNPRLVAYAHYMHALQGNPLTLLAFWVLNLFRATFELALSRESRAREFRADRLAAQLTSPDAVSRALVKVAGYASYRHAVERELFDHDARHEGPLQVADRVAQGLPGFAQSEHFQHAMAAGDVPHPFDSHPPLQQRMDNVGSTIPAAGFAGIVSEPPAQSWVDLIPDAAGIESRLWQRFESAFADEHEQSLAFRYAPATEAERALVLKYFPDVVFDLKKGGTLRVTFAGIESPDGTLGWDQFHQLQYQDGSFGTADSMTVTHPERGTLGTRKSTRVRLPFRAASDRDRFKPALNRYWQRHQVMRRYQLQAGG